MKHDRWLLAALILLQVLILAGMLLWAMMPLRTGRPVELAVAGIDPRDLFRGNYVALNYSFNALNREIIPTDLDPRERVEYGDVFYVELAERDSLYEPAGLWRTRPDRDGVFLHTIARSRSYGSMIYLQAGIESYFLDPDRALVLEERLRSREERPTVTVMIAPNGEARIKSVNYP